MLYIQKSVQEKISASCSVIKSVISVLLSIILTLTIGPSISTTIIAAPASDAVDLKLDCRGAILMEAHTGEVLYEQNADEALPPASVTKIMTLLIVMEAMERGAISMTDMLTTSDNAASMGGSQIYLEPGEKMSVSDLLKSVVVSSANDAAVVLAEAIAGSEEVFVTQMNKRAAELGMLHTHFENTNGLDDTVENHVISARDVAIMSRALITHKVILEISSIWMDTVRNGAFGLSNTNRLIRFYPGANGLKTGSTSKAHFCISATATRDGMTLIAVVMASPTRDARNAAATRLLDWGFAEYSLYRYPSEETGDVKVTGGISNSCRTGNNEFCRILRRGEKNEVNVEIMMNPSVAAPVREGDVTGSIKFTLRGDTIGETYIVAKQSVEKISFGCLLFRMLCRFFAL